VSGPKTSSEMVLLRRTWPQRLVIAACMGVIGAAIGASFFVQDFYSGVADIGRIQFSGDLLQTDTGPSDPVTFLIVGLDSAVGIDPNDPIHIDRQLDDRGTHNADSISLLRVDPVGGQAWAVSIPRDLLVDIPGSSTQKINASSLIGGAPLLVETVVANFEVPINHYVQLDFLAFRDVVEKLDGVPMWFPHPARDARTGLLVIESGCNRIDGEQALALVRSRSGYEEFHDGEWISVGADDFGRIQRQQAFVVAALERAIARGARNPTTLASLIDSAAESVVLDQGLTPAELIQLAEAFTGFDTDSLQTFSPAVIDVFEEDPDSGSRTWRGLQLVEPLDAEMFQLLRGVDDAISRRDVRLAVAGPDDAVVVADTELLRSIDFAVTRERIIEPIAGPSVIVHPSGQREHAELLARHVVPTPAIVEDPAATEMTLVLGSEHQAVSVVFAADEATTLAAVSAHGDVAVPVLRDAGTTTVPPSDGAAATAAPSSTTAAPTTTAAPATTVAPSTTAAPPTTSTTSTTVAPAEPVTALLVPGRAPEGESCS